jgi:cytochrome c-type protein NapC
MADTNQKHSFFTRKILFGTSAGVAIVFMLIGVIFWGGFNTVMEATNTLAFCISCHEMEENVYQEYKQTVHYKNSSGVRAICSDCHVPDPWVHKFVRKVKASRELFDKMLGTIDTPEKFKAHRMEMATRVWQTMKSTNSRECRNCHDFEAMSLDKQRGAASERHQQAIKEEKTCIDCHKGIAHKLPEEFLEQEHDRFERESVPCSDCHSGFARPPENDGWD